MSVAFVREDSALAASEVELPERPISEHPNFVTEDGLARLKEALVVAQEAYGAAQAIEDVNERRRASAPAVRDLRYFSSRVQSAQIKPPADNADTVAFGHLVTFEREDGRKQVFRIVGEDEADPSKGTISYVSPVSRALLGKRVGDVAQVNGQDLEIIEIS